MLVRAGPSKVVHANILWGLMLSMQSSLAQAQSNYHSLAPPSHPMVAASSLASAASSQVPAANALAGEKDYLRLDEAGGFGALARGSYGNIYIALD